jgi:uncharacterized protein YjbI with pentapeptide repeats
VNNSVQINQSFAALNIAQNELVAVEFDSCTFTGTDFNDVTFNNCRFIDCQFEKCNLSNCKIAYCRFNNVAFNECKLVGIDWTRVSWPNIAVSAPIAFTHCILNNSSFFGLNLSELVMSDCKACDVDFREADLSRANFSSSDLAHSLFNNNNLQEANFTDAHNYNIDVANNMITGAKFCRDEAVNLLTSLGIELVD